MQFAGGHIYAVTSTLLIGDMWKIGLTTLDPGVRLGDLGTALPGAVMPHKWWVATNVAAAERRVHEMLAEYRIEREWFRFPMTPDMIQRIGLMSGGRLVLPADPPTLPSSAPWTSPKRRPAPSDPVRLAEIAAMKKAGREMRAAAKQA